MKTHRNPEKFLCIIQTCRDGPLTHRQLREHLVTLHIHDYSDAPHFGDCIAALPFLGVKLSDIYIPIDRHHEYSLFHIFQKQKEGRDACPIRGCDFRLSINQPVMEFHLDDHDMIDRLKSHKAIEQLCPNYGYNRGVLVCPMCQKLFCRRDMGYRSAIVHFQCCHSKEARLASPSMLEFCRAVAAVPKARANLAFEEMIREQEEAGLAKSIFSIPHQGSSPGRS